VLWVVALTDGYDNASNPKSKPAVYEKLRNSRIALLAITVGSLENEPEIRQACEASRDKGLLIQANTNSDAIKKAFTKVIKVMMTGNLKVESL